MFSWLLAVACAFLALAQPQTPLPAESRPADSQPASRPGGTTLRKPAQVEILKNLLSQRDRPTPVQPQDGAGNVVTKPGLTADGQPLLLEGTFLVERPGRLVREEGRAAFTFITDEGDAAPRSMPILENQLLETLEREADAGFSDFIVSGEVTNYRGKNFLLLRKVLRRTAHGNVGP